MKVTFLSLLFCLAAVSATPLGSNTTCTGECGQKADEVPLMNRVMKLKIEEHQKCVEEHKCPTIVPAQSSIPCVNGKAGDYDCENVDLLSFMPLKDMGCGDHDGNDIWGWTDDRDGKEYAIVGCMSGTSFVDITDPKEPIMVAFMPSQTGNSIWRDIKVYNNHAFIVSEALGHGMQVYNLGNLQTLKPGSIIEPTTHYNEMSNTHNIVANEESGTLYAVGTNTCNGGLHIIDVKNPIKPVSVSCYGGDGYTHDAQCVNYKGADAKYKEHEICFCYNEDTLTIVDVTDKQNLVQLSRTGYKGHAYTHQGWLNEEQTHLLMNDELDEVQGLTDKTRSMIWDVQSLEDPKLIDSFFSSKGAVDHNLYIRDNLAYESNYAAGLRILNIANMNNGEIKEVGYFDMHPENDFPVFEGAWSAYIYFKSKTIVVSSIELGLFVLKYTGPE